MPVVGLRYIFLEMPTRVARRIAVVEDEETIREGICAALRRDGHAPLPFGDGLDAWQALARDLPDLVILDIGLPQIDGLELCRRLRGRSAQLPIVFVTSREEEFDRVLGLEIGADDYMCKPFSMRELMARVKVLLRRANPVEELRQPVDEILSVGRLSIDPLRLMVTWGGAGVSLTVTEVLLLQALARRPGVVKTRDRGDDDRAAVDTASARGDVAGRAADVAGESVARSASPR